MTGRAAAAAVALTVLVAAAGCSDDGDSTTSDVPPASVDGTGTTAQPDSTVEPATTATGATDPPATTTGDGGVRPEGFTTVTVRATTADGSVCEKCMWLADEAAERGRGLMGVTDLGEPVGMIFRFETEVEGSFFMVGTPTPLSIAWFAADGSWVDETDMEPCVSEDGAECQRFGASGPYQFAIEVVQGGLTDLGIGPGSSVEIVAGTEADGCVLA